MTRSLYLWLLRHHPAPFRERFADEMAAVYDEAEPARGGWSLVVSAATSLVRQQLRSVLAAPQPRAAADARACDEHRRYLALELQLAGQGLGLFALALVVDRRIVMTGLLVLFAAGLVCWRLLALARHRRTYLPRLSTERWMVRFQAEHVRRRSQQSARMFLYVAAMWGASSLLELTFASRQHAVGPNWPVSLAFTLWFALAAVHHRRATEVVTRELVALDEVGARVTGPLGLDHSAT